MNYAIVTWGGSVSVHVDEMADRLRGGGNHVEIRKDEGWTNPNVYWIVRLPDGEQEADRADMAKAKKYKNGANHRGKYRVRRDDDHEESEW